MYLEKVHRKYLRKIKNQKSNLFKISIFLFILIGSLSFILFMELTLLSYKNLFILLPISLFIYNEVHGYQNYINKGWTF